MNCITPPQKLPLISGLIGLGGMLGAVISLAPPAGALGPSIASGVILGLALHFNIITIIALTVVSIALVIFIAALIYKNAPPLLLSEINGDLKNLPIVQTGKEYLHIITISHGHYQEWIDLDLKKFEPFPPSIIKYSENEIFIFIKKTTQREYTKLKRTTIDPEESYYSEGTIYSGYCLEFSEDTITDIREAGGNITSIDFNNAKLKHKVAALKLILAGGNYDGWTLA